MRLLTATCHSTDMGVQLFLDILRSIRPSHVVRLIPKRDYAVEDVLKALPQLTEEYLTATPGLFTPPDKATSDFQDAPGSPSRGLGLHVDPFPGVGDVRSTADLEKPASPCGEREGADREGERAEEAGDISSDIEMYGSSEEEFAISR